MKQETTRKCVLYDRDCIDCGQCDMCELDPQKRCDNCMRCVHTGAEYNAVIVDKILTDHMPADTKHHKGTNV